MRPVVALIVLLFAVSAVHAVSVDNRVTDGLKNGSLVDVIVTMKPQGKIAASLSRSAAISSLSAGEFRKGHEFKIFNGFSGAISASALNKLKNNPMVDTIEFDEPVHIALAESAPLINATRTWQVIAGANITGAGETVCVIDTGVNYTHAALGGGWGNKVIGGYDFVNGDSDPMDDHGHGTHVAGIVASNDSVYRGVAPDAKIVAIKALNAAGSGSVGDIAFGIDWCITNATQYNITVISMSIGTDSVYSSYCDSTYTAFSSEINAAVAAGISVVVASGNEANITGISSPACIQNSTAVGATYDADVGGIGYTPCSDPTTSADQITCFTNRNSLLDLLAPGALITSTNISNNAFVDEAGTSMAAPMVAGAFALIHQYSRIAGASATPAQIETVMKASGKNITDTGFTNLTFQRINIFAAIKLMDTIKPSIVIYSPANITYNSSNISLAYSVSDDIALDRCWFTNTTGSNVSLSSGPGACQNATFLLMSANGNITLYANDTNGNTNSSFVAFSLNMTTITIQSPQNNGVVNINTSIPLNFTVYNVSALDKTWYHVDNGDNVTVTGNTTFNTSEGNHLVTVYVNNTFGIIVSAASNFTVDITTPSIAISAPINVTLNTTNDFVVAADLNENGTAVVEWNGTNITMAGNGTAFNYSFVDVPDGNYTYRVYANDTAGNVNATAANWVYVNVTRNFSSYFENLTGNLAQDNVTISLRNSTGITNASSVALDINYTLQMNASGIVAFITNFSWLNVNTSNFVNITRNVTVDTVSTNFTSSGGVLDSYVWIDVNNFTSSYTPVVSFPGRYHIAYYINGSRDAPEATRITNVCDGSNVPCYIVGDATTLYLSSFSGAAVGNDTQAPSISVTSPAGTYTSSNISIACSAADNVGVDSYWYALNGGSNTAIINCSATLSAAGGSNTLVVYANDSSGNTNSSSVSFTYTVPAPQPAPSGGGGGAIPPSSRNFTPTLKKYMWDEINKSVSLAVSVKGVPVTGVDVFVNSRALAVSATIMPSKNLGGRLDDVYNFFAISFTNLPESKIDHAVIRFYVNRSWVSNYDKNNVSLYRYTMGWDKLVTTLKQENDVYYIYDAVTPGFSTFAIVGGKAPLPLPEQKLCAQVITAAIKDGECVLYPTPCDVPEGWQTVGSCPKAPAPADEPVINNILIFVSFFAGVILVWRIVYHRSRRKAIEHRVHHHRKKHEEWLGENALYKEYQTQHHIRGTKLHGHINNEKRHKDEQADKDKHHKNK